MNLAAFAETSARRTRAGIERDQARVHRRDEDAALAGRIPRRGRIEPCRYPAVREVAVVAGQIQVGVEGPALLSRGAVNSTDAAERRRDVEHAVNEDRRRLVPRLHAADAIVARAVDPRRCQRGDVTARDLVGRRVFRAAGIAGVGRPLDRPARGQGSAGKTDGRGSKHSEDNDPQSVAHL